ncbi:MAG: hypothetical protein SFV15_06055 [Polyangiaceae bacterium]|nr:hypothetical protein [Polyangiaceae bacterium]
MTRVRSIVLLTSPALMALTGCSGGITEPIEGNASGGTAPISMVSVFPTGGTGGGITGLDYECLGGMICRDGSIYERPFLNSKVPLDCNALAKLKAQCDFGCDPNTGNTCAASPIGTQTGGAAGLLFECFGGFQCIDGQIYQRPLSVRAGQSCQGVVIEKCEFGCQTNGEWTGRLTAGWGCAGAGGSAGGAGGVAGAAGAAGFDAGPAGGGAGGGT